ncbi:hypothetical protein ACFUIZ_15045 [Streptomyces cinereoruber]|uniref:Uncharacterized protein n=1 Tax=Streptomyces cinereoruber TaxID=67260 RepID=A0ABX6BMX7_9ACTN|nr:MULTISPECIES: hypothetical protein [unclassified Streptomyces]AVH94390.1 hypothetical protein C5L38_04370 [Streptomyces sp. WAC00288]QEV35843.1 hypothetical protein CP977_29780 [Streptomyces cinereoruber]
MKLTLWRLVLDPVTSWRARRLQRARPGTPFDAAWRSSRMLSAPDEMVYRLHGHTAHPRPSRGEPPKERW